MNNNWGFDWSQESTKRNAVWLPAGVLCLVLIAVGGADVEKQVALILSTAATIASALGVFRKD